MKVKPLYFVLISYFVPLLLAFCVSIDSEHRYSLSNYEVSFFTIDTYLYIVGVNLFVYLLLILGIITFKITTIINLISNGINMGYFLPILIKYGGLSFLIHATPEMLGLFIGAFIGLSKWGDIKTNYNQYISLFIFGIILIIFAGALETYITPFFYN